MKKFFVVFIVTIIAQCVSGQIICGYFPDTSSHGIRAPQNVTYGDVFTPKGQIRVLIVFVSYGMPYDLQYLDGWPTNSDFPLWATNALKKSFYTDYSEFSNNVYGDTNRHSVSNFYYQMSRGTFEVIADYYPRRVVVQVDPSDTWGKIHQKALAQISNDVNWSLYDNRTNNPSFLFDNSTSNPDGIVDFIVFCHRYSKNWPSQPSNNLSDTNANGFAGTDVDSNINIGNGYYVNRNGFTYITGNQDIIGVFVHEVGHDLYNGPHYAGGNGVAGRYFYEPGAGWGMMKLSGSYTCATAWERYILDWIPQIKASGIPADIDETFDFSVNNGIFILRDFITTGDAIRIKVPAGDNKHQYLWLENHQCKSTFDGNINGGFFCNTPIDEYKKGLIAYVESYSHAKDTSVVSLFSNGNGVRWLSRDGDFDFSFENTQIFPEALCNFSSNINPSYPLFKNESNSVGGQNVNECIRHDYNNNGYIEYDSDMNSPAVNEQMSVVQLNNNNPTASFFTGTGLQFLPGDKVGLARNPCVINIPEYDASAYRMGSYYLNGISFEVLAKLSDGRMIVRVRIDDVAIDRDVRWAAGEIVLTDITGDNRPDVNVQPGIKVNIDKSETPNRHRNPVNPYQTSSTIDDFITPTTFTCQENSYFKQENGSIVNVVNNSTLMIESGATFEIGDNAVLNIEQTGTLIVRSGATLRVKGAGHVEVKHGAYICIENGANIVLEDAVSVVNLRPGYNQGLNLNIGGGVTCNCVSLPSSISIVGNGHINNGFQNNRCIQKTTYTQNAYETGNYISAGYNICIPPYGKVKVSNGARVVFDGEGDVFLKNGIEVEMGSSLEIR